jgi:hypothetical protein
MATSQLDPERQKKIVLDLFLDAWNKAVEAGVDLDLMSEVLVYMGVTDLVADRGEDWTAEAFEDLPERIREGEFTLPEEMVENHSYDLPNPYHA